MFLASNIKYLRNKKNLSQQALADEIDISRSKLVSYEDSRAEPSISTLIMVSNYFKLPIDTLVKHNISLSNNDTFIDIGSNRVLFPIMVDKENNDVIEVVPIKASAGYTNGYSDPEYISNLPQMDLPFLPTGKHRAFPINGDSMEPWVKDGSFVIGKYVEDIREIRDGQTYVVVTEDDGLVYKRIYTNDHTFTLKSDNTIYSPYNIVKENVLELWEYTCKIDMQAYNNDELNIQSIMNMMRGFQIELEQIKQNLGNE